MRRPSAASSRLLIAGLLPLACADGEDTSPTVLAIRVQVPDEVLVPGSRLVVEGSGFLSGDAGETAVYIGGERVTIARSSRQALVIELDEAVLAPLEGDPPVETRVVVEVQPADGRRASRGTATIRFSWAFALEPTLEGVPQGGTWPGQVIALRGGGLVDGSEGTSTLEIEGHVTREGTPPRAITGSLPLLERRGRSEGRFYLDPGLVGLQPGRFEGRVRLQTTARGAVRTSAALPIALDQRSPEVAGFSPAVAARGQRFRLQGAGFLPGDAGAETATLVRLTGTFTPTGGTPEPFDRALVPERWIDHTEVELALRTGDPLSGRPGLFEGTARVELFSGFERATSPPIEADFEVAPPAQHVRLVYLPGFSESLARFGLAGAEDRLRRAILDICQRDFAELRVFFEESEPEGWLEYATVELGGRDPNGLGLFGLDNSPRKDEGNLRLDELLGGRNAETAAAGQLSYGGIFLESFLSLSPGHPDAALLADARFDEIFGPFSPAVSPAAEPLWPGEVPDGERARQVDRAVDALANLVGSTLTHEIGHALGLVAIPGQVHNPTDTEGGLMDSGADRPFAERAALTSPGRFLEPDRSYLRALFGDER